MAAQKMEAVSGEDEWPLDDDGAWPEDDEGLEAEEAPPEDAMESTAEGAAEEEYEAADEGLEGEEDQQEGEEVAEGAAEEAAEEEEEDGGAENEEEDQAAGGGESAKGSPAAAGGGSGEVFKGVVYRVGGTTGNMLIKSLKVREKYGQEAVIIKGRNAAGAKLGDRVTYKVVERGEQRPLATSIRIVGHVEGFLTESDFQAKGKGSTKGIGKGKAKGKDVKGVGKGKDKNSKGKNGKGKDKSAGKGKKGVCADLYFAGVVMEQTESETCTIKCDKITDTYGCDAWFPANEKPPNVRSGNLLVFTVHRGCEAGTSPRAQSIAKLAPLGSLGAPAVRKTITRGR